MHGMNPALAHRDLKPLNVLLTRAHSLQKSVMGEGSTQQDENGGHTSMDPPFRATLDREEYSMQNTAWSYQAVLADFGSTRPAHMVITTQIEAQAAEQDARVRLVAYLSPR